MRKRSRLNFVIRQRRSPARRGASKLIGLLISIAATVPAAAVTLVLTPAEGQAVAPRGARLFARPVLAAAGGETPAVQRAVPVPGTIDWALPSAAVWQIEVAAAGLWAAPVLLPPGADEARVELWRTGRVGGMLLPPQDGPPPREIRLRFVSSRRLSSGPVPPTTTVCPVEHTRFTCEVPAGADLDLRIKVEGFASRFFWHRRVAPGEELSLGPVPLVRGGSVAGWVAGEDGGPPAEGQPIEVILSPAEGVAAGEAVGDERGETAALDAQGFFQVVGVMPGRYVAKASAAGGLRAESLPLTVLPDRDSELIEPLVLRPPLAALVRVSPAAEPAGGAWRVDLQPEGRTVAVPRSGRTDAAGEWRTDGLTAGRYLVVVRDARGRRLHVGSAEIDADESLVEIEIERVEVVGRVWLGDRPLAARVILGGRNGAVSLSFESDEEGRFTGWVPREGPWRVDVVAGEPPVFRRLVDVAIERPRGQRVARVEIRLPDTLLEGEVVDADGRPVGEATLLALQVPALEPLLDRRVRGGRFALRGLAPGTYRLEAVSGSLEEHVRSEAVDVILAEEAPYAHARLVLAPPLVVEGQVTSAWGGVPAAEVFARPLDQPPHTLGISATSDHEGRFRLRLPPGTQRADLEVMAPGYAFAPFPGVGIDPQRPLALRLDETAGDLVLDLDRPWAQSPYPIVEHNGHAIGSGLLGEWMRRNGLSSDGRRVVVPRLPPGIVRVCRAVADEPRARLSCDHGVITAGGSLELSVLASESSAASSKGEKP